MFFFMLAIFVILASVVVYLITKRGVFSAVGLVAAAALIVLSCVTTVPTGHTGVVTTFGHVENYTLDAGVHMVKPWQQVVKMDNRVQKQTPSRSRRRATPPRSLSACATSWRTRSS